MMQPANRVHLPRKAKGERPTFFADPNVDKVIAMVMGLAGEVAVLRDRVDTLERLLEKAGVLKSGDIDAFQPSMEVGAARAAWRESFLGEVLRIVQIEQEALAADDIAPYADAVKIVESNTTAEETPKTKVTPKRR